MTETKRSRVRMRCPDGHEVIAEMDFGGSLLIFTVASSLTVNGIITHKKPCPTCGKPLSAPGGTYTPDENGLMLRVEDVQKH